LRKVGRSKKYIAHRLVNQATAEENLERRETTRAPPRRIAIFCRMGRRPPHNPLGDFIRNQREIARLTLRQLANLAHVSNPYLSQIERGLYEPSASVLKAIADALGISREKLYEAAGWFEPHDSNDHTVESAIRTDPRLSAAQKEALIVVYRGFVEEREK